MVVVGADFDYNDTVYLTTGSAAVLESECADVYDYGRFGGAARFSLHPCSPETFALIYGETGHHPSCLDNLDGISPPTV